jgi:hypothetical protein
VSSVAAAGKASSTSFILTTGSNTCRPTKRSDIPVAWARRSTDSDDVVVARILPPLLADWTVKGR